MSYESWHALEEKRWTIHLAPEQPKDYSYALYEAKPPKELPRCRKCGRRFVVHDSRDRLYKDLPQHLQPSYLSVPRRRLKCCTGIFTEKLDELDEKHMATRAFVAQLERATLERRTFSDIARFYGVEHKTIRNINRNYIARKDKQRETRHTLIIPHHLGIHPTKISRTECCLLTNVERRTVFEVVSNQSASSIRERFAKLFDPSDLKGVFLVSIPPNDDYKKLVKSLFPEARILVPTRYLASLAGDVMERALIEMKSEVDTHAKTFTTLTTLLAARGADLDEGNAARLRDELSLRGQLQAAYYHKEWFLKILASRGNTKTVSEYNKWCRATPPDLRGIFSPIFSQVSGWKSYVFPNTDVYYSQYLADLERLIKDLLLEGRRYSFEVIRGRLLYSPNFQTKLQRTPTQASCDVMTTGPRIGILWPEEEDIRDEFGASFEKICEDLERYLTPHTLAGKTILESHPRILKPRVVLNGFKTFMLTSVRKYFLIPKA